MKSRLLTWTALAGSVYAGCGGATQETAVNSQQAQSAAVQSSPDAPPSDEPLHPELPQIRSLEDAKKHAGKRAEIHGIYLISRTRALLSPVTIVLADNKELLRSKDIVAKEDHLQDKPVVIVGTVHFDPSGHLPTLNVETLIAAPGS